MEVLDEFCMVPSSYIVCLHVNTLSSPDGTRMIDNKLIRYNQSIDGVLLPLILHNYFSQYDIDFLIYLIQVFKKEDALMPHVKEFLDKRNLGEPYVRKIRNLRQNFMVRCVFNGSAPGVNWECIKGVKQKLRELFDLKDFPYVLHFIGWSVNPLSVCYQLPLVCMGTVRLALEPYPSVLTAAMIDKVVIEVGSTKYPYDSMHIT